MVTYACLHNVKLRHQAMNGYYVRKGEPRIAFVVHAYNENVTARRREAAINSGEELHSHVPQSRRSLFLPRVAPVAAPSWLLSL